MKEKRDLLLVLALVVALVGVNAAPAAATTVNPILPNTDTLPDGALFTYYEQTFSLSEGTGTYQWYATGLPNGIGFVNGANVLYGYPQEVGTFNPTVTVRDSNGAVVATRSYTLVVPQATSTVTLSDYSSPVSEAGETFTIQASAAYLYTPDSEPWSRNVEGLFAFYLDGATTAVTGCEQLSNHNASSVTCTFPADLSIGTHTIRADFTPTDARFTTGSGTIEHTIGYHLNGTLFEDKDKDGVWDAEEAAITWGPGIYHVSVDKDCDESVDRTVEVDSAGTFSFPDLYPNVAYCVRFERRESQPNWVQTTLLNPVTLDGDQEGLELGLYWVTLTFSPEELPDGELGAPYEQQITVIGGTAPYTFSMDPEGTTLPGGMNFDETGMLSGTPTAAGLFPLTLNVVDVNGMTGSNLYHLSINIDGSFELTSAPNPSAPGEEVTFTLSATGDAVHPALGPLPPVGYVTFYADGTEIEGCTTLLLNADLASQAFGNYPAVCKTSALAEGVHTITAAFTDLTYLYNDATVTMEGVQMVGYFYHVSGTVFNDANYNKFMDAGEVGQAGWSVHMGFCDGSASWSVGYTDVDGAFTSLPLPSGQCYTIYSTLDEIPFDWAYTVFPAQIDSLTGDVTGMNIGAALMAFSPEGFPDGTVGEAYDATVTPLGGIGPFSFEQYEPPVLPAGLTQSFDLQTGAMTLSGTPTETQADPFFFEAYVYDSLGSEFRFSSLYTIAPAAPTMAADLSLTKTDSKDPTKPGAKLTYTLVVSNLGPDAAENVVMVDTLDRNTSFVSYSAPKGWTCTHDSRNNKVTCTAGDALASGSSATIRITVLVSKTANVGKELVNNAAVSSTTNDPNLLNNSVVEKTLVAK